MSSENARLTQTIRNLEKDIGELKREIHGRDEAIGEKEKRIADLARKMLIPSLLSFINNMIVDKAITNYTW